MIKDIVSVIKSHSLKEVSKLGSFKKDLIISHIIDSMVVEFPKWQSSLPNKILDLHLTLKFHVSLNGPEFSHIRLKSDSPTTIETMMFRSWSIENYGDYPIEIKDLHYNMDKFDNERLDELSQLTLEERVKLHSLLDEHILRLSAINDRGRISTVLPPKSFYIPGTKLLCSLVK